MPYIDVCGGEFLQRGYRFLIPGIALVLYGALGALWWSGAHALYFGILRLFAFEPFRFPFVDIHYVLSVAQCYRLGIDVYLANPCDALGRVHDYSPLWLRVTPNFLDTGDTTPIGLGLGLLFIGSLAAVCRPTTSREALVLALVVLSPITAYALERANNDLIVFMLILAGCAFLRASGPSRFAAYALYIMAGLLKYYPLAMLVMLLRERWRDAILASVLITALVLVLLAGDHAELSNAIANIPTPSYYTDSFAAVNLPFGLAAALAIPSGMFGVTVLATLGGLAIARAQRSVQLLGREPPDWNSFEVDCLIAGAIVLIACFLAARNVDYRGIYFVLLMPGLIELRRTRRIPEVRRFLYCMISAVLFVSWEEPLRLALYRVALRMPHEGLRLKLDMLFWLGRELVWWWLIAGLAAIVFCYLRQLPLVVEITAALPNVWLLRRWRLHR
jgi:hypothetical protein